MMNDYKSITINHVPMAYREQGQGKPVLLIHGFASASHTWLPIIKSLPPGFRYVALDLKGFGRSGKPRDKKYSAYDHARLVTAFIREMELDEPVVIGHSFGGVVSLFTVLMNLGRLPVRGLVLINTVAYFTHVPDFIKTVRPPFGNLLALAIPVPNVLVRRVLKEVYYDPSKITRERVSAYAENLQSNEAKQSLITAAAQFVPKDLKRAYKNMRDIRKPVLIIRGADDRVIPVEESYALKRELPQAELHLIPMCGHSPQEECPEETAFLISKFLEKV